MTLEAHRSPKALRRSCAEAHFTIFMLEWLFGTTLTLSTGSVLPVRFVGEQHVLEDLGRISTVADWLLHIQPEPWMLGHPTVRLGEHAFTVPPAMGRTKKRSPVSAWW